MRQNFSKTTDPGCKESRSALWLAGIEMLEVKMTLCLPPRQIGGHEGPDISNIWTHGGIGGQHHSRNSGAPTTGWGGPRRIQVQTWPGHSGIMDPGRQRRWTATMPKQRGNTKSRWCLALPGLLGECRLPRRFRVGLAQTPAKGFQDIAHTWGMGWQSILLLHR